MTEDQTDKTPNAEPSVLDYIRAKLMPWLGPAPEIPPLESEATGKVQRDVLPSKEEVLEFDLAETILGRLPWRTLSALLLALLGQVILTVLRQGWLGGVFYLAAIAVAVWAMLVGELSLAEPGEVAGAQDEFKVAFPPLAAGLLLSLGAFLAFSRDPVTGDHVYTGANVLLWAAGLGLVLWALWFPRPDLPRLSQQVVNFFQKMNWQVTFNRHTVLLALAFVVAVFFRVNRVGGVVTEMFSDHAEKLLDVYDVLHGQTRIFFPRNTGREGFQFYLIAWTIRLFNTGISFLSMKIGTIFFGIFMLPYIYLLGKELGNRWVGLLAMLFAGISFWPNILARVALRFILYPAFAAPTLYYLVRGLRTGQRRYFIFSGIFLGIGLHGYTPFRAVPVLVVVVFLLYWLHGRTRERLSKATVWLGIIVLVSLIIFLPLLRVWIQNPEMFNSRLISRMTSSEIGDQMPSGWALFGVFWKNVWNGLLMFNWDSGTIWTNTIPNNPSLDIVSGAAFVVGSALVLLRYLRDRRWEDMFLLLGVPVLMLPSTLVLAFPAENPAPNRAGGAAVIVFILIGLALEGLLRTIRDKIGGPTGTRVIALLALALILIASGQNYSLTFERYPEQYSASIWNTSELGEVIAQFTDTVGSPDQAWVIAYPHWVDTRLVGINAGFPTKDFAIWPEDLGDTLSAPLPKLFLFKVDDENALPALQSIYPEGKYSVYNAYLPSKNFYVYYVP